MRERRMVRSCICGYRAEDLQDLDEHILASIDPADPPTGSETHRPAR